jgi:pentatricopeptide repeat protein
MAKNHQPRRHPHVLASKFVSSLEGGSPSTRNICCGQYLSISTKSTMLASTISTIELNDDQIASDNINRTSFNDPLTDVSRLLKESTVEAAAREFHRQYSSQTANSTAQGGNSTNFALVAILNSLHKSPQQSEDFVKALQKLSDDPASNNENNLQDDDVESWYPSNDHYHMVLYGWIDYEPPSAKRVQALVEYMKNETNVTVDTDTYNLVLKTWVKKKNAERAQDFFDEMVSEKNFKPDATSFSLMLEAWSLSKSPLAAKRADDTLRRMKRFKVDVDVHHLSRVIECWAKSRRKGVEVRMESLMGWMHRQIDDKSEDCDPQVVQEAMYNVLQAYQYIKNAHRAEELLLEYMAEYQHNKRFPPSLSMCMSVLTTWSKSKSSRRGHRAEKLLTLMENDGNFPDPTVECYTAVLNCYAGSHKPDAAQRAETLLRRMEEKGIQANLVSFTCVLIAWARSENIETAPIKAEQIFQEILDRNLEPDRFVYSGLITAWGRSTLEDSIFKVEEYLQRVKDMQHERSTSSQRPTVVEYTATIQAYANYVARNIHRSRMVAERVESLLDEMLDSDDPLLRPNTLTYAAVLSAIAGALRIPDRGDRADAVLRTMRAEKVEITPFILGLAKKCSVKEPKRKQKEASRDDGLDSKVRMNSAL